MNFFFLINFFFLFLFREFEEERKNKDPDDERDIADMILQNLINQDRSKRMVVKKLKEMNLISSNNDLKTKKKAWTETEEDELRVLFNEHKDSDAPMMKIMEFMVNPKPRNNVLKKLLELGIIQDKSEVKKKKKAKSNKSKGKGSGEAFLDANSDSDLLDTASDSSDDENIRSRLNNNNAAIFNNRDSKKPAKKTLTTVVTPHLVSAALNKVRSDGNMEAVEWLVEVVTVGGINFFLSIDFFLFFHYFFFYLLLFFIYYFFLLITFFFLKEIMNKYNTVIKY